MSLLINKLGDEDNYGCLRYILGILFLFLVILGPIVLAAYFDLSNCSKSAQKTWSIIYFVLFVISFEIVESKFDKSGKHILTISYSIGFIWQLLLLLPFILITHPEASQVWNCARSLSISAGVTVLFIIIELIENCCFSKKQ